MTNRSGTALALAAALALTVASGAACAETLRMWGPEQISDPVTLELWNDIKAGFEADNPGVTVEFIPPTGTITNGAVQAAIQSDAGPDVVLTNSGIGRISVVAKAKLVAPLTAHYDNDGWDKLLYPWLYTELKRQFGGEIYEVPDGLDALGIWYHKDMFTEHGWTIPATYQEFLGLLDEIQKAGIQPIAIGPRNTGSAGHFVGNLLQVTAGRDAMAEVVSGKRPWTDPTVLEAATRLTDLVHKGYIQKEMAGLDLDGASRLWLSKRAAIFVAGPWFTGIARKADYDLDNAGFATMPTDLDPSESITTGGVGWSWLIPVNSKQPELAAKWIEYILSDGVMKKRAQHPSSSMIYPRELQGVEPPLPILKDIFAAASKGVGYNPSVYIPGNVVNPYYQVIQGWIGDQITAADGMAQIQAEMEKAE